MRISILGSGTGIPSAERGPAGFAVAREESLLLVDGGSGSLSTLARLGLDYRRIGAALFTHCHADHTLDLVLLLHALNFTPGYVHEAPLRLIGPAGFSAFLDRLLAAYPSLGKRSYALELSEVGDGAVAHLDWADVAVAEVPHGNVRANAYRIACQGAVAVFSGDCSPSLALADLARGADLLVSEASFTCATAESGPHMTAGEAGHLAEAAGVGTLALTHFYPGASEIGVRDACAREFGGQLILGRDEMCLEVAGGRVTVVH
ncbi:MAG: MBL fold metallo-hydrolase [Thermoleophilia bacterium]